LSQTSRYNSSQNQRILILGLILVLCAPACISPKRTPNLARVFAKAKAQKGKRPIILIPGMLGSELINAKTGERDWPSLFRSDDEGSSLPLSPDLPANRDDLIAGGLVETLRFGKVLPEVNVYRDLLKALQDYAGYEAGDWVNPPPNGDADTFYVFAYDWRRDNVESARELARRIVALKQKLNRPDLQFNIIAHSMGGLIARYLAMYGDKDLPDGDATPIPDWSGAQHISKILMLGVPNEGSADAFATLLYGYSITEGLRRRIPLLNKLSAEDAITSPALFQLIPHATTARFLNQELKPVEIDLYDPEVWKMYGWSVISDPRYRERYAQGKTGAKDATPPETRLRNLDLYFAAVLTRAKQFHRALDAPSPVPAPVKLLALGGDCEETLDAPLVLRDRKGRWLTLIRPREFRTSTGEKISKRQVTEAMYAPGDGRVTRASLLGVNGDGGSFLAVNYAVFICDLHGQLQRNKIIQDNALTALVGEVAQ
jgi:pimeloyl-ACP methyl ester carboxylesterase